MNMIQRRLSMVLYEDGLLVGAATGPYSATRYQELLSEGYVPVSREVVDRALASQITLRMHRTPIRDFNPVIIS